jgi:Na+/H+-dicarboxylate symporter
MVFIIGVAMRLAPFAVFALIFGTTARFGFSLLQQLGLYVLVVLGGLAIQMFVVFPLLVKYLGGRSPRDFFRKVRAVIVTAFSTSSSAGTLPTSIRVTQEQLKVPAPIAGFVLPLGATMNMNGTALFEGVTAVFLAQVFGFDLTLTQQILVVVLCVITAIGAAGIPGGSIPLLAMVLAVVGVPAGAIAIILGVDRLLDMCRTTVNVVGDVTCAVFIHRSEGEGLPRRRRSRSSEAVGASFARSSRGTTPYPAVREEMRSCQTPREEFAMRSSASAGSVRRRSCRPFVMRRRIRCSLLSSPRRGEARGTEQAIQGPGLFLRAVR